MRRYGMLLLPLLLMLVIGCKRTQEVERAETPGTDAQRGGPLAGQPAQAADSGEWAMPAGAVEAAIKDFSDQQLTRNDTLYVAFNNEDPPRAVLQRAQTEQTAHLLPVSRRPQGAGVVLYMQPETVTAGDSLNLIISWERFGKGASGVVHLARVGTTGWTVKQWSWQSTFDMSNP